MRSALSTPIRPPAVAGRFYPSGREALAAEVARHLAAAGSGAIAAAPPALVAPHAGYAYSGPIAGSAFAAWQRSGFAPRRVVLLGPNHYVPLAGIALPAASALATPLGTLPVPAAVVDELLALPFVSIDAAVHAPEHSLEVELPFLQVLFGEVEIVPLLVGEAGPEQVAAALAIAWSGPGTAVVVSSDLSHFLSYEEARAVDGRTAGRVCDLEGGVTPFEACGARSLNGLLLAARRRGLAGRILDLRNSGDTAGPRDRVVGYGAFAFDERVGHGEQRSADAN
jgi:AmmeMemoRadiSam system protein B